VTVATSRVVHLAELSHHSDSSLVRPATPSDTSSIYSDGHTLSDGRTESFAPVLGRSQETVETASSVSSGSNSADENVNDSRMHQAPVSVEMVAIDAEANSDLDSSTDAHKCATPDKASKSSSSTRGKSSGQTVAIVAEIHSDPGDCELSIRRKGAYASSTDGDDTQSSFSGSASGSDMTPTTDDPKKSAAKSLDDDDSDESSSGNGISLREGLTDWRYWMRMVAALATHFTFPSVLFHLTLHFRNVGFDAVRVGNTSVLF